MTACIKHHISCLNYAKDFVSSLVDILREDSHSELLNLVSGEEKITSERLLITSLLLQKLRMF